MFTKLQTMKRIQRSSRYTKRKKPRKKRMIKNGIVNVDDVHVVCGSKNVNWLKIAKRKLTERELKLLQKRQRIVDAIIKNVIQSFVEDNMYRFNFQRCVDIYEDDVRNKLMSSQSAIMLRCSQDIAAILNKWRGYKPDEETHSFRAYFQRCRHWFDTKKITLMTHDFWIPIMAVIQEFAAETAVQLFDHQRGGIRQSYSDYLNVLMLKALFEGHIKPANTRNMWLVPAMSYPKFLRKCNQNLQINLRISRASKKNKDIRLKYLRCLDDRCEVLREAFDLEMNAYCALHNASQPSSRDNYNVFSAAHNTRLNPRLNPLLSLPGGMFNIRPEDKYSLQINHNNNHNNINYMNTNSNEISLPQIPIPQISLPQISSSSPSRDKHQLYDLSNISGGRFVPEPFAPRNHSNSNHNGSGNAFACNDIQRLEQNQMNLSRNTATGENDEFSNSFRMEPMPLFQSPPLHPCMSCIPPPIRAVHNLRTDYMNESSNWFETQLAFPPSCVDCNPWCNTTKVRDADWFPLDQSHNT